MISTVEVTREKKSVKKRVDIVSIRMVKDSSIMYEPRRISSPGDIVKLCQSLIGDIDREELVVISLNTKNEPVSANICSRGSLNASIVHPREVAKAILLSNANSFIICHNHPSGDISPSSEDKAITSRLKKVGELIGVKLLDHIIIGSLSDKYFSFKEEGLL